MMSKKFHRSNTKKKLAKKVEVDGVGSPSVFVRHMVEETRMVVEITTTGRASIFVLVHLFFLALLVLGCLLNIFSRQRSVWLKRKN